LSPPGGEQARIPSRTGRGFLSPRRKATIGDDERIVTEEKKDIFPPGPGEGFEGANGGRGPCSNHSSSLIRYSCCSPVAALLLYMHTRRGAQARMLASPSSSSSHLLLCLSGKTWGGFLLNQINRICM